MKSAAKLRVIEGGPSVESELADLFAQENVLLDELRDVRAKQADARKRYARTHGLLMMPSWHVLRGIVGK